MRLFLPLFIGLLVSGCAAASGPMLTSLAAWERGSAIESSETRRLDRLEVPRNAQLTFRVLTAEMDSGMDGEVMLHCRVHTVDGGMITWGLTAGGESTEPIRAKWLKRVDVLMGTAGEEAGARLSGPAALVDVPAVGALRDGAWERLSAAVEQAGGQLAMAANVPIYPGEKGAPGVLRRYLVFEGVADAHSGPVVSAVIELAVEIIDRDYRPKQKEHRAPERHDPVREPPPRDFAALR
ncbi:MAG: hypothetical protein ACPGU1_09075 [Myxococcota bacterium]